MLRRRPSLIAFDLDGTLVDSAPDLAYAIDRMLSRLGRPPAGEARVRGWIGEGMAMLVRRAITGETWPKADPPDFAEAVALFTDIYGAHLCVHSRLYGGVAEGLAQLHAGRYPLACITNKPSRFTQPLLEQLSIARFFDVVGCGDQFARQKPDPEPLLKTTERFGLHPSDCLMVGDSPTDAKAARRAGYRLILVSYGYHGGEGVDVLGPDAVIHSLTELPGLLGSLPQPAPARTRCHG